MNGPRRRLAATAVLLPAVLLAAGCAGAPATSPPATQAAPPSPSLNTSLDTAAGTWAAVVMGGSAAQDNDFWQLFIRPAGSTRWKLVTPPGTADNGGLVLAGGGQALVTGFRPSQDLTYTPLIETSDGGQAWSSLDPLDAALASAPDALAVKPGGGQLLALLDGGPAEEAAPVNATWTPLAASRPWPGRRRPALRAAVAHRRRLHPARHPVLAGPCTRPGTAGIFTAGHGTWQAAGPAIPAALIRQDITVSRLTRTAQGMMALLQAGSGPHASLLPPLPPGTATLAPGVGGAADALAVRGGTLTVWQHAPGGTTWAKIQVINVPIPYGSSS